MVINEVLSLEILNLASQLKLRADIHDEYQSVNALSAILWFRKMEVTIATSTSGKKRPINDRLNAVNAGRHLETMMMVGHTSAETSNRNKSRWLSLSPSGGLRGFDLARHPRLSILREHVSGNLPSLTSPFQSWTLISSQNFFSY